MNIQAIFFVIFIVFSMGFSGVSLSKQNPEHVKYCQELTINLVQIIMNARREGRLDLLKDSTEIIGSTEPSQMVKNRMLFMATLPSITVGQLRTDGYGYCLQQFKRLDKK